MSSRLPLKPANTAAAARRKRRVCTREACETCREKKSKCDGDQPCSRCESRGLECTYKARNYRSKRSLRNELNDLRERLSQYDALFTTLQDPAQRDSVLQTLQHGRPVDEVVKILGIKVEEDPGQQDGFDTSMNYQHKGSDDGRGSMSGSASPFAEFATPSVAPAYTTSPRALKSAGGRSVSVVSSVSDAVSMQPGANGFVNPLNSFAVNDNSPMFHMHPGHPPPPNKGMSGMSVPPFHNGWMDPVDNNMFSHGWLDPALVPANNNPSFAPQHPLPFPQQFAANQQAWDRNGHVQSQASPTMQHKTDPRLISPSNASFGPWGSQSMEHVDLRKPSIATTVTTETGISSGASDAFGLNGKNVPSSATSLQSRPSFHSSSSSNPSGPDMSTNVQDDTSQQPQRQQQQQRVSGGRSASRERHRLASARNWHKQKQVTADLQTTKSLLEARHAALKKEFAEVLTQVQEVKNALLGHAGCNDPAIGTWLRRQAVDVQGGLGTQKTPVDHQAGGNIVVGGVDPGASSDGVGETDDFGGNTIERGVHVDVEA